MPLTPVKLFSTDPQQAKSMGMLDPISLFNDSVLPQVNSLIPQEDDGFTGEEFGLDPLDDGPMFSEGLEVFKRRRDQALSSALSPSSRSGESEGWSGGIEFDDGPDDPASDEDEPEYDLSRDLTDIVKDFEGFTPTAKWDYKQSSIGYGTKAKKGETSITKAEAARRLNAELAQHRKQVVEHANKHGYKFTPRQLDALTSFNFNTGRLEQLTDNGRRTPEEIAAKIPQYRKAGGEVLPGLVKRRKIEQKLFTGR